MSVKSHFSWQSKVVCLVAVVGMGVGLSFWAYHFGKNFSGTNGRSTASLASPDLATLKQEIARLTVERDRFSSVVNAAESESNIAQATQVQLSKQIASLEVDNARLKEDLAFFEGLLPTATGKDGIAIQRLSLQLIAPTQLRYRSLIMRGGKIGRDFIGDVQIVVTAAVRGKSVVLTYPEKNANVVDKAGFQLDFKYYQRIDGVVILPDGAVVKTLQARVREKGTVLAQQTVEL
ncbi:DUF6776 family protein [Glaciimonas sp. PAMC28666]|uniref:DUF6776 family protein n=1 Tax=Glaciimonas sp. PAMC28666 TaxID=2807626 RepID=UPI001F043AFF|nr:DUF6776 family protein [Glaciimonas sp. PAMC28666]